MENVDLINVLMEMRNGKAVAEMSGKFNELIAAIKGTGKGGKLVLTLNVKPSRAELHEGVKEVVVKHECKIDKPEITVGPSTFYMSAEGKLTRSDPDQAELFEEEKQNA